VTGKHLDWITFGLERLRLEKHSDWKTFRNMKTGIH
jgi:hypothetical protein